MPLPRLNDEFEMLELRVVETLGLMKQLKLRVQALDDGRRKRRTEREEIRLLDVFRASGRRLHFKDLCHEISWSPSTIKRYLKALTLAGQIDHRPEGYGLVN